MYTSIDLEKDSLLSNTISKLLIANALLTKALEALNLDMDKIASAALAIPNVFESHKLSGSLENGLIDTLSPSYNNNSSNPSVNL